MTKNTKWTFIYLLIFTSFQKLKELKSHDWICCDETLPHLISCVLFFFILLFLCRFFIFTLFCVWKAKMNQIKKQLQTQKKQIQFEDLSNLGCSSQPSEPPRLPPPLPPPPPSHQAEVRRSSCTLPATPNSSSAEGNESVQSAPVVDAHTKQSL